MIPEVVRHEIRGSFLIRRGRRSGPLGREEGDRLIEMLESGVQPVEGHERRADEQVPVDEHSGVALTLPKREDLPAQPGRFVELGAEQVEAGQAS